MENIDEIVRQARRQAEADARARVRQLLRAQPAEWLADQLLLQVMGAPAAGLPTGRRTEEEDRQVEQERALRLDRIRSRRLDRGRVAESVRRYRELTRERLEAQGLLVQPPGRGSALIEARHRSPAAAALLDEAKDLLYALLFGTEEDGVRLQRVARELLTLSVPQAKAHAVAFLLRPAAEVGTGGAWHDLCHLADDRAGPDLLIRLEYGETVERLVGAGVTAALKLINNLELNEQALHAGTADPGVGAPH